MCVYKIGYKLMLTYRLKLEVPLYLTAVFWLEVPLLTSAAGVRVAWPAIGQRQSGLTGAWEGAGRSMPHPYRVGVRNLAWRQLGCRVVGVEHHGADLREDELDPVGSSVSGDFAVGLKLNCLSFYSVAKIILVIGGGSCKRGREFESKHQMYFSPLSSRWRPWPTKPMEETEDGVCRSYHRLRAFPCCCCCSSPRRLKCCCYCCCCCRRLDVAAVVVAAACFAFPWSSAGGPS